MAFGAGLYAADGFKNYLAKYRKKFNNPDCLNDGRDCEISYGAANGGSSDGVKNGGKDKKNNLSAGSKKKILTLANAAFAVLLCGAILAIVSMPLGSIEGESWLKAREGYMTENGYFNETVKTEFEYPVLIEAFAQTSLDDDAPDITPAKINKIVLDLFNKNAVVIYDENALNIKVKCYLNYENQITAEIIDNALFLTETPSPRLNRPKDKMLFFLFEDNEIDRQIKITVPARYKDAVEIIGAHIIAK